MAPNSAAVTGLLRQAIYYHLDNGSWDNALFFAERLSAHDPRSNESAYLLALSHMRVGDNRSAYEVSKPLGFRGLHLGCAFVFAQSCLALERHRDGALALEKAKGLWLHKAHMGKHTATTRAAAPDAATVNCLLGKLYRGMDDRKKAAAYFEDALRTNPLMWDAFTALCDIGLNVRVANTFRISEALVRGFEPEALQQLQLQQQHHQQHQQHQQQQPQPQHFSQSDAAAAGYLTEQQQAQTQAQQQQQHPMKRPAGSAMRPLAPHEMSDPFDQQPHPYPNPAPRPPSVPAHQVHATLAESEENDFMARIFAARSRVAAAAGGQPPSPDGMATPPGMHPEPPQAPMRRRAGAPTTTGVADSSFAEGQPLPPLPPQASQPPAQQQPQQQPGGPSKIMYRLGATARRGRPADGSSIIAASGDLSAADHASSLLRSTGSAPGAAGSSAGGPGSLATSTSASTAERKRTASGHPVAPRYHTTGGGLPQDDSGAPQRRSARLNMFKASAGRTNANAGTAAATGAAGGAAGMGATAMSARELKKARPAISRIVRPGSSGSTVGRVVSGNRKPVDDGNMDIDPMEGPRVREPAIAASSVPPTLSQQQQQQHQQQQQQQQQYQHHQQQQQQHPSQQGGGHPYQHLSHPAAAAMQAAANRQTAEAELLRIEEALRWILELLKKLAGGYLALSQFQCAEALQILQSLPRAHADTPWVQAQMGRAQYELAAYAEAEVCFRRVRVLAPTRLEDMEVYSTILWFLKRETDLSFLAHELVDAAWLSPQAWCALGNAWSLAQDHEQALRCFRRATQLNPRFAYAHTLQGHEHVLNEEYDKALTAYRHAVAADRRHYNAYYGIGRVYEKLGNLDKAYAHYHTASAIHPTNAVLVCCLGKVLERQKQIVPALQYFSKATDLAPRAAQTRFRKARALLALGQLQAAQHELTILKDLAPDEAMVHFLLGKLHKTLNDKSAAVRHFTIALSLDPKASQKIKQAIGSLEDDEDGLEDYMVA